MGSTRWSPHDSPGGRDTVAGPSRSAPKPDGAMADLPDAIGRAVAGDSLSLWLDRRVRSSDGDSLGITAGVYAHRVFRHPAWLIVDTGMPGAPVVVAPARGSSLLGDDIVIGADRDAVLTAPTVHGRSVLDPADERSLTAHYARCAGGVDRPARRCTS